MQLTVKQAHLERFLTHEGATLHYGDPVGIEGATGKGTGRHTHTSIIQGWRYTTWRQGAASSLGGTEQMLKDWFKANPYKSKQYKMTTPWGWYTDFTGTRVNHEAYDTQAIGDRTLIWPYQVPGKVAFAGGGDSWDYGNHILIHTDTAASTFTEGEVIDMGTIEFAMDTNIRSQPSLSAPVVGNYKKGEKLHGGDGIRIAEGYVWVHYKSKPHGYDRWVAIAKSPWVEEV